MKILVTGCAGLIGSHLVDELIKKGHDVTGVDDLSGGKIENVSTHARFRFIQGDLTDIDVVQNAVAEQEMIFHLAAYAAEGQSVFSPDAINRLNIIPMNKLLVAAVNNGVKRFVFTSSMAVYGNQRPPFHENFERMPTDPYGIGKVYCEQMLESFWKLHGLEYVIIRPHNCYGPRQNITDPYRNVLGIWMNMILRHKRPIIYGDGDQTRAFSYVIDTVRAIANSIDCPKNEIINVGGRKPISINEACEYVLEAMGSKLRPLFMESRLGEVKHAYCTTQKSEDLLKYRENYKFETGVRLMARWIEEVGPQEPTYRLPLEITKGAPAVWRERMI